MSTYPDALVADHAARRSLAPVQWYAIALGVVNAGFAAAAIRSGLSFDAPLWIIAALAAVAALAERQGVRIGPGTETSISVLPILFAAVVYGPLEAMLVAGCALLPFFGAPYTRWAIWTSIRALAAGTAGLVALALMPATVSFGAILLAVVVAALAEAVTNAGFSLFTALLRGHLTGDTLRVVSRLLVGTVPLYAPVIAVLAYAYKDVSPWTVLLFLVPALAAQRLLLLYQEQRQLAEQLASANSRLESASLSFASALVSALDARDRYTAGHSAAVAVYARDIATHLGLSDGEQRLAHLCGLLHDIGKVGVPSVVLEKNGTLTNAERQKMEEHSAIGERILANVEGYDEIASIVRHHHERVDGKGYPDGLTGPHIPLIARIIAVADAYNAMTSGRPYREALPSTLARRRLAEASDSQFDPEVVAAFEAILEKASHLYMSGGRADFAVEAQKHPELARPVTIAAA